MTVLAAPGGGPDLPVWGQIAFAAVAAAIGVVIVYGLWSGKGK